MQYNVAVPRSRYYWVLSTKISIIYFFLFKTFKSDKHLYFTKNYMFVASWVVTNANWFVGNQNTCFAGKKIQQAITLVPHWEKNNEAIYIIWIHKLVFNIARFTSRVIPRVYPQWYSITQATTDSGRSSIKLMEQLA